jgi:hypothetical protein
MRYLASRKWKTVAVKFELENVDLGHVVDVSGTRKSGGRQKERGRKRWCQRRKTMEKKGRKMKD